MAAGDGTARAEFAPCDDSAAVARRFTAELRSAIPWSRHASWVCDALARKQLKATPFEPTEALAKGGGGSVFLVMISGHVDFVLERLGRACGMPRGFPVLWWPGDRIQMFGFRPKFANDDRQQSWDGGDGLFQGLGAFKKWSGFLGQLIAFEHGGRRWWATCSKNSGAGAFAEDAARLFGQHVTAKLVDRMLADRIHVCAEVMSTHDQGHGARVLKEIPVVTSIGVGTLLDLRSQAAACEDPSRFVVFKGFAETIAFCRDTGLPVGAAVVATGAAAPALIARLSEARDEMTNEMFNGIVASVAAAHPEHCRRIEGTVTHSEVLGDCLEGLVIHAYRAPPGKDPSHEEVAAAIESGKTKVVKFKFPGYTVRTMCIRTALGRPDESGALREPAVPLSRFEEFVTAWASRWCVTSRGRKRWRLVAWEAMLIAHDLRSGSAGSAAGGDDGDGGDSGNAAAAASATGAAAAAAAGGGSTSSGGDGGAAASSGAGAAADAAPPIRLEDLPGDDSVGLHIRLAEHVMTHGVRPGIEDRVAEFSAGIVLLTAKVTVVLPFATEDVVDRVRASLEAAGIAVAIGNKPPKSGSSGAAGAGATAAGGWVSVVKVPTHPSDRSGTVYEYPCEVDEASLEQWQRDKFAKLQPAAERGVVAVADDAALLAAIRASSDIIRRGGSDEDDGDNDAVTPVERKLRDTSNALSEELVALVRARGVVERGDSDGGVDGDGDVDSESGPTAGAGSGAADAADGSATARGDGDGTPADAADGSPAGAARRPLVVLLVGPQAIGKSRACEALADAGLRVCSADIHMHAGGRGFDPTRLEECHRACMRDVAEALVAGGSAVVDNTNLLAEHRAAYHHIARLRGADVVSRCVAPALWLEAPPSEIPAVVDALVERDVRRCLARGSVPLGRAKIERAVNTARANKGGDSVEAWLARVPPPSWPQGVVENHGALVYRSAKVTAAAEASLASGRVTSHPGFRLALLTKSVSRGFGEFHVTLAAPDEWRDLKQTNKRDVAALGKEAAAADAELFVVGVGRVEEGDDWVLFVVFEWAWAQRWRESVGLPPKDLHATIAFSSEDIHGVPKGKETCEW